MLDAISATQTAMLQDQIRLQSISQNVSNMQTPGYKRQLVESTGFHEQMSTQMNNVQEQMQHLTQLEQGALTQSQRPLEMAITGNGYFEVQTEEGVFYTRRGDFHVNEQGELATPTGAALLGQGGPIHVDDHAFKVDASGNLFIENQKAEQLNIVRFDHPEQLKPLGMSLYASEESPQPVDGSTRVLQGFIEQSNVKSVDEMMEMVKTARHFEASQRVMRIADGLLSTAINRLGE